MLERALVIAGGREIRLEHLPMEIQDAPTADSTGGDGFVQRVDAFKKELLLQALREAGWSKKTAAARLGLSPRAMSHYVGRFDLDRHRS